MIRRLARSSRRLLGPLALGAALVSSGCVGPFASRPRATASATPAHAGAAPREGGPSPRAGIDPAIPVCDDAKGPATATGDDTADPEHTTLDDGFESPLSAAPGAAAVAAPFADLSDAEIASRLRSNIGALGPISIGRAHGGVLVAGSRMPEGKNWHLVNPGRAWGTRETVDGLSHAIDAVATRFPDTPPVFVGDISAKNGGHIPPHVSHQSGRDVDIGYYMTEGRRWYATANASNLDRPRTWHFIRTLIADSDIDFILIDREVQRILKAYALEVGEDPGWLDQAFQIGGKSQRPLIFHANGHANHLHVRFYSPVAQEIGRRAYFSLVARHLVSPPTLYITHTVKTGETLSHLALRYKVTSDAIKKANALTNDVLRMNKPYKIPQTGGIALPGRVVIPPRRVPPALVAAASAKPAPCRPRS